MSSSRWPRKLWPLALFFRMLAGFATPEEPLANTRSIEGDALSFGNWAVGCDNLRVCTAIAFIQDGDAPEGAIYVQMTFTDKIADAQTIAIMRDGKMLDGLSPLVAHRLTEELLDGSEADAVYRSENSARFGIPRTGFKQVVEVLGKWRAMPPRQLMPTDPITSLPAVPIDNPVVHPNLSTIAERCPEGHLGTSMQAWELLSGNTLWRAGCGDEGLNTVSFWFVSGPQGAPPVEIKFEDSDNRVEPFNSWFDAATGYLRTTHYFGRWDSYQEDCGIYRAYAFGPGGMKLVEKRFMPNCGTGIGPEGWITTFRATTFNGRDSGP
jgi:hypothetical protein